jgi:hypothetical protein
MRGSCSLQWVHAMGKCRYCFAPLEPDWQMVKVTRTYAEILTSQDLWDRDETLATINAEMDRKRELWREHLDEDSLVLTPRLVRVRVDRAEFCSKLHADAFAGKRTAVKESLGEFRTDDEPNGPVQVHPGQGSLLG